MVLYLLYRQYMSSDYDIKMNLNDTIELDTIIEKSNNATKPININTSIDYDLSGIKKHTCIYDPKEAGECTIKVNNQSIKIKVVDTGSIPKPDSGVIRWKFEDSSDVSTAIDDWNNNSGLISEATYINDSAIGVNALQFNVNSSQYVKNSTTSISNEKSISAWIKVSKDGSDQRVWECGGQNNNALHIAAGDSTSYGSIGNNEIGIFNTTNSESISTSINYGNWTLFTTVYDGSKWILYENDTEIGTNSNITTETIDSILLGNNTGSGYNLNDKIDDFRLYDKALSSTEINNLYNNSSILG